MKNFITIITVIMLLFSHHDSFAQYASAVQSEETSEVQSEPVYYGQGQALVNTGKTLVYTGASIALTGLAGFIAGAATYDPDPCCPTMPMFPLFGIAGGAVGALVALTGVPFYMFGKNKMESYGASHIVFGNETQKGGTGMFEVGIGVPNFISMDAAGGYNFNRSIFLGGGVGFKTFTSYSLRDDAAIASIPVYANARFSFGKKRVVPFISASAGYDLTNTGLYTGLEFGTRFRDFEGTRGQSWWFGLRSEMISTDFMFISVKVGRSF